MGAYEPVTHGIYRITTGKKIHSNASVLPLLAISLFFVLSLTIAGLTVQSCMNRFSKLNRHRTTC